MRVLVVVEHDSEQMRPASRSAIAFARQLAAASGDGELQLLVLGHHLDSVTSSAANFANVYAADHPALAHSLADRYAPIIASLATECSADVVVAGSSSWAKDVIARAAGLLGGAMASDVIGHQLVNGQLQLVRPMYAGAVAATIVLHGEPKIITIQSSAYAEAAPLDTPCDVSSINFEGKQITGRSEYKQLTRKGGARPDVTEARIVVAGGRAFKDAETFERLVGGLADRLQAATGSSRALVDAGITPNSFQVGQTGKVVAPDLYLALGISGAVQHLAGMKNSRVIAAINNDPDAPIFEMADYGLVGDIHEVVPQLIEALS